MALVQLSTLGENEKMLTVVQQSGCVIPSSSPNSQSTTSSAKMNNVLQVKRPLDPLPTSAANCKRKIQFYQGVPQQPASVARRNARERNRVKQVNNGFAALRQHIPPSVLAAFTPQDAGSGSGRNKKLSKVETLRLAVDYIRSLQRMLDDHESEITTKNIIASMAENARFYNADSPEPSYATYPVVLPTPPSSEASASPTPSQTSDGSYSTTLYVQETYPKFEPKSPEDEELLDAIFSWQQNE